MKYFGAIHNTSQYSEAFLNNNISNSSEVFHNTLQNSETFEEEFYLSKEFFNKFPNEAYVDLMTLVLKNKLSNATGNQIISFFNKYLNLSISSLPKNIQQGHIFMNNMRHPDLEYYKTCVLNYNNVDYFLYHWPLISCIKNILEIPDLFQNFALNSEVLYKNIKVIF